MEVVKEVFTIIGVIIGVLTGLATLYAKYLELKKNAARVEEDELPPVAARRGGRPDEFDESHVPRSVPRPDPEGIARARQLVRVPAIALMGAGVLSLLFNLFFAGFGFVDEFVTPLGTESKQRKAAEEAKQGVPASPTGKDYKVHKVIQRNTHRVRVPASPTGKDDKVSARESDKASAVMALIMLMGFSVASAGATWAGYSMLHLRSYWLSVAGSLAVMPGACFCCLTGIPIGVWSLVVLFKPEVRASFQ